MASADQIMPVGDSQPQEHQDPERGTMKPMEIIDPSVPEQQTSVLERIEATLPGSTRIQKWSFVAILTALLLALIAYIVKCTQTSKPLCPDGYVEITARRLMDNGVVPPDCTQDSSSFDHSKQLKSDLVVEVFDSAEESKNDSKSLEEHDSKQLKSDLVVEVYDSTATIKSGSKNVENDISVQGKSSLLSKDTSWSSKPKDTSGSSKPKDSTVLTYQDENFMDDREFYSSILQEPSSYTEGQGAMDTSNMVTDDLQVDQSTLNFLRIDEEEEDLKEASNAVSAKMSKVDQISDKSLKIDIDDELVDRSESAKSSGDHSNEFQHDVLDLPIIQEAPQQSPGQWLETKALAYKTTRDHDLVGLLSPRGSRSEVQFPGVLRQPSASPVPQLLQQEKKQGLLFQKINFTPKQRSKAPFPFFGGLNGPSASPVPQQLQQEKKQGLPSALLKPQQDKQPGSFVQNTFNQFNEYSFKKN